MTKYNLKIIDYSDYPILFEWANDPITRKNSFNSDKIKIQDHKEYVKGLLEDKNIKQYIFYINNKPTGTIKEKKLSNNEIELSYTISPKDRNKKIGSKMMMKYLEDRKGNFLCKIKQNNLPSIKMVERCGFKLFKVENKAAYYILKLNNE